MLTWTHHSVMLSGTMVQIYTLDDIYAPPTWWWCEQGYGFPLTLTRRLGYNTDTTLKHQQRAVNRGSAEDPPSLCKLAAASSAPNLVSWTICVRLILTALKMGGRRRFGLSPSFFFFLFIVLFERPYLMQPHYFIVVHGEDCNLAWNILHNVPLKAEWVGKHCTDLFRNNGPSLTTN